MKTLSSIPIAPGAVSRRGHASALTNDPMGFLSSLVDGDDLVKVQLGPHEVVLICDPELTQQMLKDPRTYDKGGPLVDVVTPLVGDGLATCPFSKHKPARKLFQQNFGHDRTRAYTDRFPRSINRVIAGWQPGQTLDALVETRRLALQIAADTLFAGVFSEAEINQIADDLTTWQVRAAQRLSKRPIFSRLPTPANLRFHTGLKRVRRMAAEAIERHRAAEDNEPGVLTSMLSAEGQRIPWFDPTTLVDHAITFLIAPAGTLSTVLSWIWHELAQDNELQTRLQAEVDAVSEGGPLAADHIPQLAMTKRVVTEALRLYPSLYFAPLRTASTDIQLGEHVLPAGTVVAYSPYIVHRRAELYHDAERFDPDRFLDVDLPLPSRHAFIPFGSGTRQCIASGYGFNALVLTTATIASAWSLHPVPGSPLSTRGAVNLTPRGLLVRAVPRVPADEPKAKAPRRSSEAGRRRPTKNPAWLV